MQKIDCTHRVRIIFSETIQGCGAYCHSSCVRRVVEFLELMKIGCPGTRGIDKGWGDGNAVDVDHDGKLIFSKTSEPRGLGDGMFEIR